MNLNANPFFATPAQRVALARQRFFDEGQRPSGLVGEAVIQSWGRCLASRREPHEGVAFDPVSAARAQTAAMRSRALLVAAAGELQQLEATLAGTACRVMLTDGQGVIVHTSRGAGVPGERVMPVAARVGVNLAEAAIGTTAPGIVVHAGHAVTVSGAEHYFEAVHGMHCAAAPVRDAAGKLVAVLDLSQENRPFAFDAASVVGLYATAIENRWLLAQARDQLALHFQTAPSLLGTPMEALAAVDGDGRVAWLNGIARRLLSGAAPGDGAEAAFGLGLATLLKLTRQREPALLTLPSGLSVWMQARLQARDGLSSALVSAPASAPAAHAAPAPTMTSEAAAGAHAEGAATLADHDRAHIERTLAECGGNVSRAARALGVSRGLLYRRLKAARASPRG